jgi:hypothetical protein
MTFLRSPSSEWDMMHDSQTGEYLPPFRVELEEARRSSFTRVNNKSRNFKNIPLPPLTQTSTFPFDFVLKSSDQVESH